ncbi:hypothetical protein GCM10027050_15590 [Psychrosphaera aestuarii]
MPFNSYYFIIERASINVDQKTDYFSWRLKSKVNDTLSENKKPQQINSLGHAIYKKLLNRLTLSERGHNRRHRARDRARSHLQ